MIREEKKLTIANFGGWHGLRCSPDSAWAKITNTVVKKRLKNRDKMSNQTYVKYKDNR